jgi:glycosyltransferase involved in cell wall biosynthesis
MTMPLSLSIVEPFYSGSHKTWVDDLCKFLPVEVATYTLPGRHWKWRMSAGGIELANKVNEKNQDVDVFLVTDMLDVSSFKSMLIPRYRESKIVLYMHENQVVYPYQSEETNSDLHYGFINYKSILCADEVWFNSQFHLDIFYSEMDKFLSVFPESKIHRNKAQTCINKSRVVPLGLDFEEIDKSKATKSNKPTILWNHRWEYDKNPDLFFDTLTRLSKEGLRFDLIVAGEQYKKVPDSFEKAKVELDNHIIHWGFFENKENYHKSLWSSTILPVTANQEFFGLSVMEAIYCGVKPILPNRLSYPGLYRDLDVFYDSNEQFYDLLKATILLDGRSDNQSFVKDYDWTVVAKTYMKELVRVAT